MSSEMTQMQSSRLAESLNKKRVLMLVKEIRQTGRQQNSKSQKGTMNMGETQNQNAREQAGTDTMSTDRLTRTHRYIYTQK